MKKIVIAVVLIALFGVAYFAMSQDKTYNNPDYKSIYSGGTYEDYSESVMSSAKGDIVLFFHANWCPSCKSADKSLKFTGIPDGLTILKVDYDNSDDLKSKYGITYQHTFVQIDSKGNMISKWSGSRSVDDIKSKLKVVSPKSEVIQDDKEVMQDANIDNTAGDDKKIKEDKTLDDNGEWTKEEMEEMKGEHMMDNTKEDTVQEETTVKMTKGVYIDYSADKVSSAKGDIVLFFHASWCPSCKSADSSLNSNTIPDGLTILKVDYDNSDDLKSKYGITYQHTFVQVDSKGNMISKWSGSRSVDDIVKKLK